MSDIVERMRSSISFRAFDGDALERSVCAQQMSEAAKEIERLERELSVALEEIERLRELIELWERRG